MKHDTFCCWILTLLFGISILFFDFVPQVMLVMLVQSRWSRKQHHQHHLGACWKRRILGPAPDLLNQNLTLNKIPRRFLCTFKFGKHHSMCVYFSVTFSWGLHPVLTLKLELLLGFQSFKKKKDKHTHRNSFLHFFMMSFIHVTWPATRRKKQITANIYIYIFVCLF